MSDDIFISKSNDNHVILTLGHSTSIINVDNAIDLARELVRVVREIDVKVNKDFGYDKVRH